MHHFTGKHSCPQISGQLSRKCVQIFYDSQCRHRPYNRINPFFVHIGNEFRREGEHHFWYDIHCRAVFNRRIDVLDGNIKIEGCLIPKHALVRQRKLPRETVRQINNRAVAHQHPLRHSRGAGCKDCVQRVCIKGALSDIRQKRFLLSGQA